MNSTYTFQMTIGSLYGSGHGKKDIFTFKSNYSAEDVAKITMKFKESFGFNFSDIARDYGDNTLKPDVIKILKSFNIEPYYEEEGDSNFNPYLEPEALLYYWKALLLILQPDLIINITELDDISQNLDHCPGYGLYD